MKARWPVKKLGDVCQTGAGGTPLRTNNEYYDNGTIPWLMSGEVSQGEVNSATRFITQKGLESSSAKIFPKNTVLVAMYGATAGQVGILRFEAATNQAVCGIFPNDRFVPEFLFYLLLSKKDELVAQATGNAQPNISQIKVKSTDVPLAQLSEQKRIVAILDEAFDGIATAKANAEKNLQNARALIQPTFAAILDSLDHTHWHTSTVDGAASPKKGSIRTGPFGSQLLHSEFVADGIPVLGIDNAVQNRFAWSERRFITPQKFSELSRYQVFPGDVLITIMGTCGRCAIVPGDIPTAINSKHICCITLDRKKCLPEFLHSYFLYHPIAQEFLSKKAKGSIMAGLNMGLIKELPLLLPPIAQQRTVAQKVAKIRESAEDLEAIYRRKLAALDELKKSLLDQAFTGQL